MTIKQMAIRLGKSQAIIGSRLKKLYPDKPKLWEQNKEFSDEDYEKIKLMGRWR